MHIISAVFGDVAHCVIKRRQRSFIREMKHTWLHVHRNYKLFEEREEMRNTTCSFEAGFARKSESLYAKIIVSFETAAM